MSELYKRIDCLCKERCTNVTALCKKSHVARSVLSELNRGKTKTITLESAAKLANALGVSIDCLSGNEQQKAPVEELDEDEKEAVQLLKRLIGREKTIAVGELRRIVREFEAAEAAKQIKDGA